MSAAALARRHVFWALDRARGGSLARSVADIEAQLGAPHSPAARAARRARLRRILDYATRTVPFHSGHDPTELASFPVVDKATYRQHGAAMRARGLTARQLHVHRTSGSTGTPFEAVWDDVKLRRNQADAIALARLAGYEVGMPMLYLRAWQGQYRPARLQAWVRAVVPVEVVELDEARARGILAGVRRRGRPVTLLGYGSALEELCRALDAGAPSVNGLVPAVVAVGEAPSDYLRAAVPRHFGHPLVTRYSNTENGLIAQEEPGSTAYRVNVGSYAAEVLRRGSDEPAAPGEWGRIVLTDLFNRAMPFIRYDTGDLGRFAVDADGRPDDTLLVSVSGRMLDTIADTSGRTVNPMGIPELESYADVRQYQLAQTGPGRYEVRLNALPDDGRDARIRAELRGVLGRDADVRVVHVGGVPLLDSGKRRIVVNEWHAGSRA
jgi:phenylacetate-CoA ligase